MKNKEILESIPDFDLSDIDYERDYEDGLIVERGSKELQLQISAELDIWLDFEIDITRTIQHFDGDYESPDEEYDVNKSIVIKNLNLYENEVEKEISIPFYASIIKELKKQID